MNLPTLLPFLLIGGFVLLALGLAVMGWRLEKERLAALARVAGRLGLSLDSSRNRPLAHDHADIRGLAEGEDRYAFNVLSGTVADHPLTLFDFHYETRSTDSKGHTSTTSHYRHVVLLRLERAFPDLLIAPEGLLSKFAQALGYDDIDFESHEFSRRYCVRGPDKRFAYDFCNPAMIQLLLDHPGTHLQTCREFLAFVREGRMDPARIEAEIAFSAAIRAAMPAYLFAA